MYLHLKYSEAYIILYLSVTEVSYSHNLISIFEVQVDSNKNIMHKAIKKR